MKKTTGLATEVRRMKLRVKLKWLKSEAKAYDEWVAKVCGLTVSVWRVHPLMGWSSSVTGARQYDSDAEAREAARKAIEDRLPDIVEAVE